MSGSFYKRIAPSESGSGVGCPMRLAVIGCRTVTDDRRLGEVLVCHAPEAEKAAVETWGVLSSHTAGLTAVGESMMGAEAPGEGPLLVCREGSIGWILRSYLRHTMTLVYAELPCSSRALPMISQGVLGASFRMLDPVPGLLSGEETPQELTREDEETYRALQDAWLRLEPMIRGFLPLDAHKRVACDDAAYMMEQLGELVGCRVTQTGCGGGKAACFSPRLAEIYALIWLCFAQDRSPERKLWFAVEPIHEMTNGEARLSLRLGFDCPVDGTGSAAPAPEVKRCLDFCQEMAEWNDCVFLWSMDEAVELDCGRYGPLTVSLTFGGDPVRERWSDFKHPSLWPLDLGGDHPMA